MPHFDRLDAVKLLLERKPITASQLDSLNSLYAYLVNPDNLMVLVQISTQDNTRYGQDYYLALKVSSDVEELVKPLYSYADEKDNTKWSYNILCVSAAIKKNAKGLEELVDRKIYG